MYKSVEKRREYVNQWRARRVLSGHYGLCKSCSKPLGRNETAKKVSGYCLSCNHGSVHQSFKGGYLNGEGYKIIYVSSRKTMLEHRYVMEQHLGRKLFGDENVHHINGERADNRIENLELWSTMQPKGQRVEDKVEWAHEILKRYSDV